MKITTINMKESKMNDTKEIFKIDSDILFISGISRNKYDEIKEKLPVNNYAYYKSDKDNLIISKLLFAVVSKEENLLKNGTEVYLPGSETNIILLDSEKGLNKEYKPSIKNNKLILIYEEDGINEYNYEDVITYTV